jgi:hypothetical protein
MAAAWERGKLRIMVAGACTQIVQSLMDVGVRVRR